MISLSHPAQSGQVFSTVSVLSSAIRQTTSLSRIASHLVLVAKAPANKVFECEVHDRWHQARQNSATDPRSQAISPGKWSVLWGE